jgi:hypothetical protein
MIGRDERLSVGVFVDNWRRNAPRHVNTAYKGIYAETFRK